MSLNEYGFVQGEIPVSENDSVTKDFVIKTIDSLVNRYQTFMGIPENIGINVETDFTGQYKLIYPNLDIEIPAYFLWLEKMSKEEVLSIEKHVFSLNQKKIENKIFIGTIIYVEFDLLKNKIGLNGNWFPNALIPDYEIYTKDDATAVAWREILKNTAIDVWESKHNFTISKIFLNKSVNTNIEIRECWSVSTKVKEDLFCYVYIDMQTGEVVKYYERDWLYM